MQANPNNIIEYYENRGQSNSTRSPAIPQYLTPDPNGLYQLNITHRMYFPEDKPWDTDFYESKRQCKREIRKLRGRIDKQEYNLARYLDSYERFMYEAMEEQFRRIKAIIMEQLERAFEEGRQRVRQTFHNQGTEEMVNIQKIRLRLSQVKQQLDQFEHQLNGASYKTGIAKFVLNDLQQQGETVFVEIKQTLGRYEDKVYLRVNPAKLSKIKDEVAFLVEYGIFDRGIAGYTADRMSTPFIKGGKESDFARSTSLSTSNLRLTKNRHALVPEFGTVMI